DEFWLAAIDRDGTIYGRNWQLNNQADEESSLLLKHKQLKDAKEWATSLQEQRQAKHADVTENEVKHRELLTQGDNLKEEV
ncbi:hypothetical protein, partial [Streptomyces scabiei]